MDYIASFTRKGKVKSFKALEKLTEYQSAFQTTLRKMEEFVCAMYGKKKSTTVNDTRLYIFLNKNKTKEDQVMNAAETLDESLMPPCCQILQEKICCSAYI